MPISERPPRGWTIVAGTLTLDKTIAGYLARDHDVRGRCYTQDCRRNCHLDHGRLVAAGLGALTVDQVKRTMQCSRLQGCSMEWLENPKRSSLPLLVLRGRLAVRIRIKCRACGTLSHVSPETMIAKLQAEQKGGDATLVSEIAGLLQKACPCGKTSWDVDVAWPDPNTIGGRRALEQAQAQRDRHRLREPTDL